QEETQRVSINPSESTLEKVRDAVRRADYQEAVKHGRNVELRNLSIKDLDELADAMWSAALGLFDDSDEEISAYDLVIKIRDESSRRQVVESPASKIQVAKALLYKGITLATINRSEEAIAIYDEVARRYGDATEFPLRMLVATALVNKGVTLGKLNRREEAIAIYDEVVRRDGDATELALQELVGNALNSIGFQRIVTAKRLRMSGDE